MTDLRKRKFKSQKEEVLYLLQHNKKISCKDFAMTYGILRYGAAIFTLRKEWYRIGMDNRYIMNQWRKQRHTYYFLID